MRINLHFPMCIHFPLLQPQLKTRRYAFNNFSYQASHFWNLLDNCFKDPTALKNGNRSCGCTNCDACVLRKV